MWSSSYDLFAIALRGFKLKCRSSTQEISQTSLRNAGEIGSIFLINYLVKYVWGVCSFEQAYLSCSVGHSAWASRSIAVGYCNRMVLSSSSVVAGRIQAFASVWARGEHFILGGIHSG